MHLAVHPSAWSSAPPQPEPQSHPLPTSTPTPSPYPMPSSTSSNTFSTPPTPALRNPLAFVEYKHQTALSFLSPSISPPHELQSPQAARSAALSALGKIGWLWPDIFDQEFPSAAVGGAVYELAIIEYVRLSCLGNPAAHPSLLVANHTSSYLTPARPSNPRPPRRML